MHTQALRRSAGPAAAMGLFLVAACGSGTPVVVDTYPPELRAVRTSYEACFRANRPDYVMITYPESPAALTVHNQHVLEIIKFCLREQDIPFQTLSLDEAIETLETPRLKRQYLAYRIPPTVVEVSANGVLMYVNLEGPEYLKTKRHPVAVNNNITVRVWFDRSADPVL